METLYRIIELIDGERGVKIIPYSVAEHIKIWILTWIR